MSHAAPEEVAEWIIRGFKTEPLCRGIYPAEGFFCLSGITLVVYPGEAIVKGEMR
jgi:hypothetical protein